MGALGSLGGLGLSARSDAQFDNMCIQKRERERSLGVRWFLGGVKKQISFRLQETGNTKPWLKSCLLVYGEPAQPTESGAGASAWSLWLASRDGARLKSRREMSALFLGPGRCNVAKQASMHAKKSWQIWL